MNALLSQSATRLCEALDPSTEAGRAALSALTQDEVEQLRVKHKQGAVRRWLYASREIFYLLVCVGAVLTFLCTGAASMILVNKIFHIITLDYFGHWELLLACVGLLVGIVGSLVVAVCLGYGVVTGFVRLVGASVELATWLQPLCTDPEQCEAMLQCVERHPGCLAYRDAVVAHRELVQWDALAARSFEQRAKEQKDAEELAMKRARQEEACRKLHGLAPLSVQPA